MTDVVLWSEARTALKAALLKRAPAIGALYEIAVDNLVNTSALDGARARVAIIGHCLREIMNRLADPLGYAVAEGQETERRTSELLRALADNWTKFERDLPAAAQGGESVRVPGEILEAARQIVEDERRGTARSTARDMFILIGTREGASKGAQLKAWRDARDFFVKCAHLADGEKREKCPPEVDIVSSFLLVERVIQARLTFFPVANRLREIADIANTSAEASLL